jgi:hypothetical protein
MDPKDPRDPKDSKDESGWPHDESERGGGGGMSETLKKLFTAGVSAAFMTEESIRSFVSEMKLPKETLNVLLQGASKSKEELMNRVTREVIGILSKIDFVKEASRFAEEHKFRITAEVEVIRKDHGKSQEAKNSSGETGKSEVARESGSQTAPSDSSETSVQIRFEDSKPNTTSKS